MSDPDPDVERDWTIDFLRQEEKEEEESDKMLRDMLIKSEDYPETSREIFEDSPEEDLNAYILTEMQKESMDREEYSWADPYGMSGAFSREQSD